MLESIEHGGRTALEVLYASLLAEKLKPPLLACPGKQSSFFRIIPHINDPVTRLTSFHLKMHEILSCYLLVSHACNVQEKAVYGFTYLTRTVPFTEINGTEVTALLASSYYVPHPFDLRDEFDLE